MGASKSNNYLTTVNNNKSHNFTPDHKAEKENKNSQKYSIMSDMHTNKSHLLSS